MKRSTTTYWPSPANPAGIFASVDNWYRFVTGYSGEELAWEAFTKRTPYYHAVDLDLLVSPSATDNSWIISGQVDKMSRDFEVQAALTSTSDL